MTKIMSCLLARFYKTIRFSENDDFVPSVSGNLKIVLVVLFILSYRDKSQDKYKEVLKYFESFVFYAATKDILFLRQGHDQYEMKYHKTSKYKAPAKKI